MCPFRCWVLRLTEASYLRPDSRRTSPWNDIVELSWGSNDCSEWPSGTWCRTWWNHSWHNFNHLKSALFPFIRQRTPPVYRYVILRILDYSAGVWLFPIGINRTAPNAAFDNWAPSLFVGLQRDQTGDADKCKGKVLIRKYSPETTNIVWVPAAHQ